MDSFPADFGDVLHPLIGFDSLEVDHDGLMAAMTDGGVEGTVVEELAADTITQIMHHMHRSGMDSEAIADALDTARKNFTAKVEEEALAAINRVTIRRAPSWAWQMIDQCLRQDADSKAADLETRLAVNNSIIALRVASSDLMINELLVDDLIDEPDFIESEVGEDLE